jgi:hypothetical protein
VRADGDAAFCGQSTVRRMVVGSPAWKPQAMLALETKSSSA